MASFYVKNTISPFDVSEVSGAESLRQQNELLNSKIVLIEKQNCEQQKRLQQLEKLVMEMSTNRTPIDALKRKQPSSFHDVDVKEIKRDTNDNIDTFVDCKMKVDDKRYIDRNYHHSLQTTRPFLHHDAAQTLGCRRLLDKLGQSASNGLSSSGSLRLIQPEHNVMHPFQVELHDNDDVISIMEEFDRTARENGLTYGMTPTSSVVSSEDLDATCQEAMTKKSCFSPERKSCVYEFDDVLTVPTREFLTPSYQRPAPTHFPYPSERGPMITPQACLTTPVLLTAEALRAVERTQDLQKLMYNRREEYFKPLQTDFSSNKDNTRRCHPSYSSAKFRKANPFANLLSSLRQMSNPAGCSTVSINSNPGKENWCKRSRQTAAKKRKLLSPYSSPTNSCISSISSHIRSWSQSLKLPYLSPLPESHCSDIETHDSDGDFISDMMCNLSENGVDSEASEEEDLVVDEVVSFSVDSINRKSTKVTPARPSRPRTESVSSITGPCVPPDLLLDTGMHQVTDIDSFDEVQEEDVLTEIAGILDGELPLEDSMIITDDGVFGTLQVKAENEDLKIAIEDEVNISEEPKDDLEEDTAAVSNILLEDDQHPSEEVAPVENLEELQNGGGFRNVADLVGKKTEGLFCQEMKSKKTLPDKYFDGKDVKLPAGSIILAVVNELGSLVPLPQVQVKDKNLVKALTLEDSPDKCSEEEIDVETVTEKTPVLEAGDVVSLLAQFEASEAVNTSRRGGAVVKGIPCIQPEVVPANSIKSSQHSSISMGISSDKSPQASATHQRIKDSLPKEIIEKIKASAKRKSTQMLSEPLVVLKGRGVKQQEASQLRSKAHRVQSQPTRQQAAIDQRVPPPLDHDYCFSPDKQKKNKCANYSSSHSEGYLNKLPDYCIERVSKSDSKKEALPDDIHDESAKKDSGVESGDVSDASVETEDRKRERTSNIAHSEEKVCEDVYNKLPPYMTDIGNVKPKVEIELDESIQNKEDRDMEEKSDVKKIKRKLNLSEYRKRIQSAQSSRCPSPGQTEVSKASSCEPLSIGELIQKMKEAEEAKAKESEEKAVMSVPSGDMEEGELQGDSDPEMLNADKCVQDNSKVEKLTDTTKEKVSLPFASPASISSSTNRDGLKGNSLGYTSRRWSSSSRSRSRSRSPSDSGKRHTSHSSRSSRGRRRRHRKSSGSSVSICRSWSRSRSRSRGRGSSESSYCSSCSCSSKSRSRSRSHSARRRDSKGYSRRYSGNRDRRHRSRSRSRSSLRYGRVTRSRSPRWRDATRSPPPRRPIRPFRKEGENRIREVEERRVIYVGRIGEGTTKVELRRRFQKFGDIVDISVHFREHGDNYGFVTFKNKDEAYNAVEHGNDDPSYPRYDLCFGGRRAFCRVQYSDLDAQEDDPYYRRSYGGPVAVSSANENVDFDSLLRAAMKRKTR